MHRVGALAAEEMTDQAESLGGCEGVISTTLMEHMQALCMAAMYTATVASNSESSRMGSFEIIEAVLLPLCAAGLVGRYCPYLQCRRCHLFRPFHLYRRSLRFLA